MKPTFNVEKIVTYLEKYKANLPILYSWNAKIEKLIDFDVLTESQVIEINSLTPYMKELQLKKIMGEKLNELYIKWKTSQDPLFYNLCLWVIKDWGGIKTANDKDTIDVINKFFEQTNPSFERIASASKVGAYMFPEKYIIYDSRVAYALNWIILSENAGEQFFPIPKGRNSKMSAFDVTVLIRLKNISFYNPKDINSLNQKFFIKNCDKKLFINEKIAYTELIYLVKQINEKLWKGDKEKEAKLYFTEMLLFSIADKEIFMDITTKYLNNASLI